MSLIRFLRDNAPFLAAGALLSFGSSFGQTFFISVFAGDIRAAFDLSHGAWGGIYTLGTTASALVMIWAGGLTDRFRARALGPAAMALLALGCLGMAVLPGGWAVALPLVIFVLRFAGQGMMTHISVVAMARWFAAGRGKALSIASMGVALGQAVLPVVFVAGLAVADWRLLWAAAAGLSLAAMPLALWLLRRERTPQSIAQHSQSLGMEGRHWTRNAAVTHWLFWMLVPALLGPPAWGTALFFQQVHLAELKPWSLGQWVALMPLFTAATIGANLVTGAALDRFGTARLMPWLMAPWTVAFLVLSQADGLGMAALGLAIAGIGGGVQAVLPGAFWAEFYGTRHIGAIKSAAAAVMVFGTAIGPGVSGLLIDRGIGFPDQMLGIAAYLGGAGLLLAWGVRRAARLLPVAGAARRAA
ncbi:MFS transporter [Limimaricola hongkongensis]|uniref:Permease of the major facilitator superfamily n=1 Tax=Limimaricola hongkongensis DSM 17492 TaxID=1122180 RepID=A0A017HFU4_9RHOB|nr:MFS transporter [Limimaricola hongkongensis]EYD73175.1 Permease of the major facilitator superfamily [Limimaricola hongkongensis DSM 17492]